MSAASTKLTVREIIRRTNVLSPPFPRRPLSGMLHLVVVVLSNPESTVAGGHGIVNWYPRLRAAACGRGATPPTRERTFGIGGVYAR